MTLKEIVGIISIIFIAFYALWIIRRINKSDGFASPEEFFGFRKPFQKPKKADDYVREITKEEAVKLWKKGYALGFSKMALIPVESKQIHDPRLLDVSRFTMERLRSELKDSTNCRLGENHGSVHRKENTNSDPVKRYLESISYTNNRRDLGHDLLWLYDGIDTEFIPHIKDLERKQLASLLRDDRIGSRMIREAIHNEAIARILEKL